MLEMATGTGVLPDHALRDLITTGGITASPEILPEQIQPASLDLRLGTVAYRVRASFLTGAKATVLDRLHEFEMHRVDLTDGAVLEKGAVYLVPLMESLALPNGIQAVANAKSSTGRLDLLTRAITDAVSIPVIASGGVGTLDHLVEGVTMGGASAVLAASIFHFGTYTIPQAKAHMNAAGVPVRL